MKLIKHIFKKHTIIASTLVVIFLVGGSILFFKSHADALPGSPTVKTNPAQWNLTSTSITVSGNIILPGDTDVTTRGFVYDKNSHSSSANFDNYAHMATDGFSPPYGSGVSGDFSVDIGSLDCGTPYYYRAYATNSIGPSLEGDPEESFTTDVCLPVVETTDHPLNINQTSALLQGSIISIPPGETLSEKGFKWRQHGVEVAPHQMATSSGLTNLGLYSLSISTSDLLCNTLYDYGAYAMVTIDGNAHEAKGQGTPPTFTIPCVPSLTTDSVTVTQTSATFFGHVTDMSSGPLNEQGFQWRLHEVDNNNNTNTVYDVKSAPALILINPGPYSLSTPPDALTCGTSYDYRAYARYDGAVPGDAGAGYGMIGNVPPFFTTSPCVVVPPPISEGGGGGGYGAIFFSHPAPAPVPALVPIPAPVLTPILNSTPPPLILPNIQNPQTKIVTTPLLCSTSNISKVDIQNLVAPGANLKLGSRGDTVKTLQKFLVYLKTGPVALALQRVPITGLFSTSLTKAVKEFQGKYNLVQDGIVGPYTRAVMKSLMLKKC